MKLFFEYRNRRTKLNLNAPLRHEVKVEQEATSKAVEDDRKYEIQCCIVRIMKARKKINFNNLMTEVIAQLKHRFQPQIPVIKKAVDTLIDKDYLERDANDRNTFSYIAWKSLALKKLFMKSSTDKIVLYNKFLMFKQSEFFLVYLAEKYFVCIY